MSDGQDDHGAAPSNSELAERTARIEENVHHVAETVDRIEETIIDEQKEIAEQVDDNSRKVATVYTYHQVVKYGLPVLGAVGSFLGGIAVLGPF